MTGITGQGTTFNLPNYVGELFAVTPTDTPFLSAIGGLTGGERVTSSLFQWQGYDLRDASGTRQRLEGANAPTAEERVRFNVVNVVEIHQEKVEVSYTKLAATGQYASTGSSHTGAVGVAGMNPVTDELGWQVERQLEQIARDVERSFIVGTFNNPSTNATARRTRGIMQATATNVSDKTPAAIGTATIATNGNLTLTSHGLAVNDRVTFTSLTTGAVDVIFTDTIYYVKTAADANTFTIATKPGGTTITFAGTGGADVHEPVALTEAMVLDLLQDVWESGGIMDSETATLICAGTLKRALTKIFITDKNFREMSRNVGGVALDTFETDFGRLNIMLNRYMPTAAIQVASMSECAPTFLEIPSKGFLFQEPLAKAGAAELEQIYGEIGLKYGNEKSHGKVLGVQMTANP
jgi:hypothetical protein